MFEDTGHSNDVGLKTRHGQETEKNSNDREFDATAPIPTENHVISSKPTNAVQHPLESEQRDKILKGEQQQPSDINVADSVKHEEHDNSGLKLEEMKTYALDE
uniref:Uncharacterized protein n=1 Tax=Parascaris equorum TaxID=6256 RepID=A0A914S7H7_PAREQ